MCSVPTQKLHSEDRHEYSGCYGCSDNSGYVRSHSVHKQEIGRICFCSDLLGYSCSHRYCGYTCGTDKRIDLPSGQLAHKLAEQHSCCGSERECDKSEDDDLDRSSLQESFSAGSSTNGSSEEDYYDVHHCIGSCFLQLTYDPALTEQVAEHQHSDKWCC